MYSAIVHYITNTFYMPFVSVLNKEIFFVTFINLDFFFPTKITE